MWRILTNVMALAGINDLLEVAVHIKIDLAHQKAHKYMKQQLETAPDPSKFLDLCRTAIGETLVSRKLGLHQYALPVKDWDELGLMARQDIINFDLDVASDTHRHILGKGRRMAQWAKENKRMA